MNRIVSILLVGLLLFSKVGFSISTHFCGGFAVAQEIVVGHTNVGCGMEMDDDFIAPTPSHESQIYNMPCCDDEIQHLQVDQEKSTSSIDVPLLPDFNANIPFSYTLPSVQLIADAQAKVFYSSPPLLQQRGFQELYQVYLI